MVEDPFRIGVNGFGCSTVTGLQGVDNTIGSLQVTPQNSTNKVFLVIRIPMTSPVNPTPDLQIKEGAVVLKSQDIPLSGSTVIRTASVVLTDVSVATHTYTFIIKFNGGQYQRSSGSPGAGDTHEVPHMEAVLVDHDDSHVANLTGSDTHSASLQGSDTHDTDENEIIDGG